MIVIGLTGSMAMGKSTAADMLAGMNGVAVLCSDDIVRGLYDHPDVIDLVKTTFPKAYDRRKKAIDKAALLDDLDHDHEKWDALEDILHPYVRAAQDQFIAQQKTLGAQIVVLDIPLLFETGGETRCDYTICVSAPAFIQQQRIEARIAAGRLDEEDAAFRLSRQMDDHEKRARADFTVPSGQGSAAMRRALAAVIRNIKDREVGHDRDGHDPAPLRL